MPSMEHLATLASLTYPIPRIQLPLSSVEQREPFVCRNAVLPLHAILHPSSGDRLWRLCNEERNEWRG